VVLFTSARFLLGATARDGQPIPTVSELKRMLWEIAFPGEEFDDASTLGPTEGVTALRKSDQRR
jgi:hypothetical protein